jgi:Rieske Fe-S protein
MERRDFIKNTCSLCGALLGLGVLNTSLSGCAPLPIFNLPQASGINQVDASLLNTENPVLLLKHPDFEFDIALVMLSAQQYKALLLECTHQPNSLIPTKTGFQCSVHGSSFALNGQVTQAPAIRSLREFPVHLSANQLIIKLP